MNSKICTKCGEEKPTSEFEHNRRKCRSCIAERRRERRRERGLEILEIQARYRSKNRERDNANKRRYALSNPEKVRITRSKWESKNRPKVNSKKAKRRAIKRNAYVPWANKFFIEEAYALAKLRSDTFGFKWEVDHIVPLVSHLVCGLHWEQNLQVIPALENSRKSNRFWPNMPEKE